MKDSAKTEEPASQDKQTKDVVVFALHNGRHTIVAKVPHNPLFSFWKFQNVHTYICCFCFVLCVCLFIYLFIFFLFNRGHRQHLLEKRNNLKSYFTAFIRASFERHVFIDALP